MAALSNLGDFATAFAPYIEELHEFFTSRKVAFGSPEAMAPFVERLSADEAFRDEMGSMVRAIIYRVRDGLSRLELLELVVVAVAGPQADQASEEIHESVRQVFDFVSNVFRSRWNPGAQAASVAVVEAGVPAGDESGAVADAGGAAELAVDAGQDVAVEARERTPDVSEAAVSREAGAGADVSRAKETHPNTAMFYRASMVAAAQVEAAPATELPVARELPGLSVAAELPVARELPQIPVAAEIPVAPEPALVTRSAADDAADATIALERRPWGWIWAAVVVAVLVAGLLAISAGLWLRQGRVIGPYPVKNESAATQSVPTAAARPNPGSPRVRNGRSAGAAGPMQAGRSGGRAAQVLASRSELNGGGAPIVRWEDNDVDAGPVEGVAAARYGVSPALMTSHLLSAPAVEYPALAKLAHVEGSVTVRAVVGRDGTVDAAEVVSGQRLLRAAALHEVRMRRYRPYLVNGRPTPVATILTVNFRQRP